MTYTIREPQEPSPQSFFEAVAAPVIYSADSPYRLMTAKLNDIVIGFFQEGQLIGKQVDESTTIEVKSRIVGGFTAYGRRLDDTADAVRQKIRDGVRRVVGVYPDYPTALADLSKALEMTRVFVRKRLCFVPIAMYSNAELRGLYAAAQKAELVGREADGNAKDTFIYYHALVEHTAWVCRMLTRRRVSRFLMEMADSLSREYGIGSSFAASADDNPSSGLEEELPRELCHLRELMAENVHNVWMATREGQGWKYGPERNDTTKEHPCMVPYDKLTEEEKEYDRKTSSETIRFILQQGFVIEKK